MRILLTILMFIGSSAFAVTGQQGIQVSEDKEGNEWATTGVASRAHNDVIMRQLMNLMVSRQIDSDLFVEKLKVLRENPER